MDAQTYRTALATLGLTQKAAGEWLGVSEKTAKRYATTGPSGPAARAIEMLLEMWIIGLPSSQWSDVEVWELQDRARRTVRLATSLLTPRAG